MANPEGFTDLRIGHGTGGIGDDTVWPSFTDIMTVIVMIFLMGLVLILIRNVHLVEELRATIIQKEQAAEAFVHTVEENANLERTLQGVEERVVSLQSLLQQTEGERNQAQALAEEEGQQIETLRNDIAMLAQLRDRLQLENAGLLEQRAALQEEKQTLVTDKTTMEEARRVLDQRLNEMLAEKTNLEATLQVAEQTKTSLSEQVALLMAQKAESEAALQQAGETQLSLNDQLALLLAEKEQLLQQKGGVQTALDAAEQEKATLGERIAALLAEKTGAELQASELDKERGALAARLAVLTEQLGQLKQNLAAEREQKASLSSELTNERSRLLSLQGGREKLEQQLAEITGLLEELEQRYQQREGVVADLQVEIDQSGLRYRSLQEEYEQLDEKFRRLVRPARSTAGRYVVEVRFLKRGGSYQYQLRKPEDQEPRPISEGELQIALDQLKTTHGDKLYTKVIFPTDSGLSQDEAWRFTESILSKYDYYYQSGQQQPAIEDSLQ